MVVEEIVMWLELNVVVELVLVEVVVFQIVQVHQKFGVELGTGVVTAVEEHVVFMDQVVDQ